MIRSIFILIIGSILCFELGAQDPDLDQKKLLGQYFGNWEGGDAATVNKAEDEATIRITVEPKLDSTSCQIHVYQKQEGAWELIVFEHITYDKMVNRIIALGTKDNGEVFKGEGFFVSPKLWKMKDIDTHNTLYMNAEFNFISKDEVVLQGEKFGKILWTTRLFRVHE